MAESPSLPIKFLQVLLVVVDALVRMGTMSSKKYSDACRREIQAMDLAQLITLECFLFLLYRIIHRSPSSPLAGSGPRIRPRLAHRHDP